MVGLAGPAETPKNLGNLPSDDAPPAEATPPDEPSAPVGASDPPDDDDAPAQEPGSDDAGLRSQLEALQRELALLRAGAQPQAPQVPQAPDLPFQITEDDVNVILQGGEKAARYMQNALKAVAEATARQTEQRMVAMYQQARQTESTSVNLRQAFYSQHGELEPYQELVGAKAQEVAAQMPWADARVLMEETAKRTRDELRRRGIPVAQPKAATRRARTRPAVAETGGGRPNGKTTLNPVERDIFQMLGAGR